MIIARKPSFGNSDFHRKAEFEALFYQAEQLGTDRSPSGIKIQLITNPRPGIQRATTISDDKLVITKNNNGVEVWFEVLGIFENAQYVPFDVFSPEVLDQLYWRFKSITRKYTMECATLTRSVVEEIRATKENLQHPHIDFVEWITVGKPMMNQIHGV